jgi:hypothetical protein
MSAPSRHRKRRVSDIPLEFLSLAQFYQAFTMHDLIYAQMRHIEKLQQKLIEAKPPVPAYTPEPRA